MHCPICQPNHKPVKRSQSVCQGVCSAYEDIMANLLPDSPNYQWHPEKGCQHKAQVFGTDITLWATYTACEKCPYLLEHMMAGQQDETP
jgi:hypothetical protein